MTENIETELTVQDILDEANEGAAYHTILEVWREVLKPAEQERFKKITPQWANRITSSYRELNFADMPTFRDRYFDKISEIRAILEDTISTDDECLNYISPEEDVENNSLHYLSILIDWQRVFLIWELGWDCTDPQAPAELASISEVHRMLFSDTGLTSLLDNINFQFTEEDQAQLVQELEIVRAQEGQ